MNEKREGQFDITHPPEPWKAVHYHEDELWSIEHVGDGTLADNALFEAEAKRIAACINFCRAVPIEYLETHGLAHYISPNGKDEIYYSFPSSMCP